MRFLKFLFILITVIHISGCGVKEDAKSPFNDLKPTGFVNDFANVISDAVKIKLENIISRFEKKSGIEIAVVTLPTLKDYSVEEAAVEIFEKWGIGKKGEDNGILILLALKERKIRIEVGYGLEGIVPDSVAGRIIDVYGIPFLRNDEFGNGIYAIVIGIITRISKQEGINFDISTGKNFIDEYSNVSERKGKPVSIIPLIFLLIILFRLGFWWFFPFFFMGGGSGYSGGFGGFSGGFGGFGGGLSGGGGASRGF